MIVSVANFLGDVVIIPLKWVTDSPVELKEHW